MRRYRGFVCALLTLVLMVGQLGINPAQMKAAEATRTNLALNKTVTASGEDVQWGNVKENAVDGN